MIMRSPKLPLLRAPERGSAEGVGTGEVKEKIEKNPPEDYGRKTKTQNNWRFREKPEKHVA